MSYHVQKFAYMMGTGLKTLDEKVTKYLRTLADNIESGQVSIVDASYISTNYPTNEVDSVIIHLEMVKYNEQSY